MAAVKASDALDAAKATAQSLNEGKVPDGVSLSVSLGRSQSRSSSTSSTESGRGSTLAAGGNIAIQATGGGQGSDLTVRGSSIQSGGDIALKADNRVRVLGSQDETQQGGSDSSGSASIGLSLGIDGKGKAGFSLNLAASRALGHRNGSATTQQDSTVAAGKTLTIDSGGDTDILGGTASGQTVKARVGGDLNLASLQDTAKFKEDSRNIGFNASIPLVGSGGSASVRAGKTALRSDYASTQTTSGIKSGDGGFDVQVQGKTTLDGAVIASSDAAVAQGRNRFRSEGRTELKDITNSAKYSADSVSVGVGISGAASKDTGAKPVQKSGPALNGAGLGSDSGSAGSVTKAGISGIAGDTAVRSGDAGSGIKPIFDADTVRADVNAQGVITKEFGPIAAKEWGTLANSMAQKAQAEGREEDVQKWAGGGTYRAAGHAVLGGLTGGTAGAVGASASSLAAPVLGDVQSKLAAGLASAGLSDKLAQSLAGTTVATAAGVTGAVAGGTAAGTASLNEDANNRQLHPDEVDWIKKNAVVFASKENIPLDVAEKRLAQQAARDTDFLRYLTLQDGGPSIGRTDAAAEKFLAGNSDTFVSEEGNRQKLFTTTGNQYLRPEMYGPDTDMAFVQKNILPGTTRTPGQGLKDAAGQVGRTVANDPVSAAKAAGQAGWSVVGSLAGGAVDCLGSPIDCGVKTLKSAADSLSNTGQALGEGAATLLDPASRKLLNDLYGQDMTGAQAVITTGRGLAAITGAAAVAKTVVAVGDVAAGATGKTVAVGKDIARIFDNDPAKLPVIEPAPGGFINSSKIRESDRIVDLPDSVTLKQADLAIISDKSKGGVLREEISDAYFLKDGFTKLDRKCGSNCFDGVYTKNGEIYIVEVKPLQEHGALKLSSGDKGTGLPVQMSDAWVENRIDALSRAGSASARETAEILKNAKKSGVGINKIVVGVDDRRMMTVSLGKVNK
ncbi:hemagglutinin repeat-containing protein [Comamonadaceae bacterium SL12-8]|uniref:Hemagglutinin repeat-containing protein n=2 Tax=Amphibiibacter pelophylacis TaxID=1799477 RepID=A0ACC6P4M0_9BURK